MDQRSANNVDGVSLRSADTRSDAVVSGPVAQMIAAAIPSFKARLANDYVRVDGKALKRVIELLAGTEEAPTSFILIRTHSFVTLTIYWTVASDACPRSSGWVPHSQDLEMHKSLLIALKIYALTLLQ